jgi:predicted membrane chloride channel (bestrophin family)
MSGLTSIRHLISVNTIIVSILSCTSTFVCYYFEFYAASFPLTLIGIAVVFPIVFSISGAYKRRETALNHYGTLKAYGRAIYLGSRDWIPETDERAQKVLRNILKDLLISIRTLFNSENQKTDELELHIYSSFSHLSKFVKSCRRRDMAVGEVSRLNQYLSKMMGAFESMKHIYQYRTPITLRAYSKVFMYVLPVLYGPYFADVAQDWPYYLMFLTPILFTVILVSLDNIQDQLENPFDQIGEDDVRINAEKFIRSLDH